MFQVSRVYRVARGCFKHPMLPQHPPKPHVTQSVAPPHHHASCRCFRTPCLALHEHSLGAAMGVPAVSGFTRGLPGKPSRSLPPALPLDTPARSTPRPPVFAPWARLVSVMKSTAGPRSRLSRRCPTAHRGRLWDSVPSVPPAPSVMRLGVRLSVQLVISMVVLLA